MLIGLKKEELVDIRYIKCDIEPLYLEDANIKLPDSEKFVKDIEYDDQIKGKDSIMPLMNKTDGKYPAYHWLIDIDVDNGLILGWTKGAEATVYYKVCDQGKYQFIDKDGNVILDYEGYVPSVLSIGDDESFGDYLYLNIDGDGHIINWEDKIMVGNVMKKDLRDVMIRNEAKN